MKKLTPWASFIWTLLWFIILLSVCIYTVHIMYIRRAISIEALAVAGISLVYALSLIRPCIRKARLLRRDVAEEPVGDNTADTAPYERKFLNQYRRICNERILGVALYPLIISGAMFCILSYAPFPQKDLGIKYAGISLLLLLPGALLFISRILSAKKRNLRLLERVYDTSNLAEIRQLDNGKGKSALYLFTREYFLNWDFNLNIVPIKEIASVRYVEYFYLFWYGTRLVIQERCGKKHVIWFGGPTGADWAPYVPVQVSSDKDAQVKSNVNWS